MERHHEHVHDNDMVGPKSEGGSSFTASGAAIVSAAVVNGADYFFDGSIKFCLKIQLLLCNIVVLVLLCLYFGKEKFAFIGVISVPLVIVLQTAEVAASLHLLLSRMTAQDLP